MTPPPGNTPPPPIVVAAFWVLLVPVTTRSPAWRPDLISARDAVTRPTSTWRVETEPSAATTRTVYEPAVSDSARDGSDSTPVALAPTIVMSADMPGRR